MIHTDIPQKEYDYTPIKINENVNAHGSDFDIDKNYQTRYSTAENLAKVAVQNTEDLDDIPTIDLDNIPTIDVEPFDIYEQNGLYPKELKEILDAFANGKRVQYRVKKTHNWKDIHDSFCTWNTEKYDYRVKDEKVYSMKEKLQYFNELITSSRDYYCPVEWEPDYTDPTKKKYILCFVINRVEVQEVETCGAPFVFPEKGLAENFLDDYRDELEIIWDLI